MRQQTHEEASRALYEEWNARIGELVDSLEDACRKAPALRPLLGPFVRMLGGNIPRTRLGRFVERVRIEYALLRLERKLARARAIVR